MIFVFWIVLGLIVGFFHAFRGRETRSRGENIAIILRWWLGITIGLGLIVGAAFHIFNGPQIAREICFTRGDGGFQFENAMGDLAIGVAAFLCIWIRNPMFWVAVILVMSIQVLGDAYGHIYQMVENDNHCADNTGLVLWSAFILPVVSVALFVMMRRSSPPEQP